MAKNRPRPGLYRLGWHQPIAIRKPTKMVRAGVCAVAVAGVGAGVACGGRRV